MSDKKYTSEVLRIHAGEMATVAQLHLYLAEPINDLKNIIRSLNSPSEMPVVILDLGKTCYPSIEATTSLLATFSQVARVTGRICIESEWRPNLFKFLYEINFFMLADKLRIFVWDEEIVGGFGDNKLNKFTKIICYTEVSIKDRKDKQAVRALQDDYRLSYSNSVKKHCEGVFKNSKVDHIVSKVVPEIAMELIINSLIWGENKVFFSAQRTSKSIKVCICDAGEGFFKTISERFNNNDPKVKCMPKDDIEAILLGCLMNRFESLDYGLADLIEQIVSRNGTVFISSDKAEIAWDKYLWNKFTANINNQLLDDYHFHDAVKEIKDDLETRPATSQRKMSVFSYPLRGTRIVFKIPLTSSF